MQAKLAVDLGNSETRIVVCFEDMQGQERKILSTIPCLYKNLTFNMQSLENTLVDYTWDTSWVYSVNNKTIAGGLITETEFATDLITPTPMRKKYRQQATDYAIPAVYFRAYTIISEVYGVSIEDLDIEWEIIAFLPAQDFVKGAKRMENLFKEVNEITFVKPEFTKEIVLKSIEVVCEGFTAYKLCKDKEGLCLVIDIGSSTTDLCLATKGKLNYESLGTIQVAGSNVVMKLKTLAENNHGIHSLPLQQYKNIALTGEYLLANGKTLDFKPELREALEQTTDRICEGILTHLNQLNVSIDTVESIIFVGGGSIETNNEFSLARRIREELVDLFDNEDIFYELPPIDIETYSPDHTFGELHEVNPRLMNIIGAVEED